MGATSQLEACLREFLSSELSASPPIREWAKRCIRKLGSVAAFAPPSKAEDEAAAAAAAEAAAAAAAKAEGRDADGDGASSSGGSSTDSDDSSYDGGGHLPVALPPSLYPPGRGPPPGSQPQHRPQDAQASANGGTEVGPGLQELRLGVCCAPCPWHGQARLR